MCYGCEHVKNMLSPWGPLGGKLGICSKCNDGGPAGRLCRNGCQSLITIRQQQEKLEKQLEHPIEYKYPLTEEEVIA